MPTLYALHQKEEEIYAQVTYTPTILAFLADIAFILFHENSMIDAHYQTLYNTPHLHDYFRYEQGEIN